MLVIPKVHAVRGRIHVPGDKSISHRSVMLGALAEGNTCVRGFLKSADSLATIDCFRKMGISIREMPCDSANFPDPYENELMLVIEGKGLRGLNSPDPSVPLSLNAMNSGTTARLLSGILSGQDFPVILDGDDSLRMRPMRRIMDPLRKMGADISSYRQNDRIPLLIKGGNLHGLSYISPVASAQVKSCILFAGLYADSKVSVTEPFLSRDHTERMLAAFGADVVRDAGTNTVSVTPEPRLSARNISVPGDISSAAWFIAAGLLADESDLMLPHVGINPTRDGILMAAAMMGGKVEVLNKRIECGEETADLKVPACKLHGCTIQGSLIPALIDELPVISVMAAAAEGDTLIRDAAELKVKESDRLHGIVVNLRRMGVPTEEYEDGMLIHGLGDAHKLRGISVCAEGDHRMAMAFSVAGLFTEGDMIIEDEECVSVSYPSFYKDLVSIAENT